MKQDIRAIVALLFLVLALTACGPCEDADMFTIPEPTDPRLEKAITRVAAEELAEMEVSAGRLSAVTDTIAELGLSYVQPSLESELSRSLTELEVDFRIKS